MVSTLPAAVPQIKAGKVRALAVTSSKRSPAVPELPTVAEATGLVGYEASTWQGFVFPAATARTVVQRMADETIKVVAMKDLQDRLRDQGYEPVGSSPAQFGAYIKSELAKWTKVIKRAGIKSE
jgi:tripartite-type tricarboxylate transporter receptor subunit TctC